jgi:osmoprotectant transport system substrate-binding protein
VRSRLVPCLAAVAILAGACAADGGTTLPADVLGDDAVTVGSFNFSESILLAELYAQAIEADGIRVERELDLGPRELVQPALERGLIELVPEYAGSLLEFLSGGTASSNLAETRAALQSALERRGLVALGSARAQDRNGFAVRRMFASEQDVHALSDLARIDGLVLGGPPECPQRPLCQHGLEGTYGIRFDAFVALDLSGPLTADALAREVVDVGLMFTTSPELVRHDLVLLTDDRHLQPAEHVTPIVRQETLERFGPELAEAIDAVSALLTTEDLRALNAQVEVDGRAPAAVARAWLVQQGLVDGTG